MQQFIKFLKRKMSDFGRNVLCNELFCAQYGKGNCTPNPFALVYAVPTGEPPLNVKKKKRKKAEG